MADYGEPVGMYSGRKHANPVWPYVCNNCGEIIRKDKDQYGNQWQHTETKSRWCRPEYQPDPYWRDHPEEL